MQATDQREIYSQFRSWRKEVERIINGLLHAENDTVKLNTVYIWAGVHAKTLVEARQADDPRLEIKTAAQPLDCLDRCSTLATFFRESRETPTALNRSVVRTQPVSIAESLNFSAWRISRKLLTF